MKYVYVIHELMNRRDPRVAGVAATKAKAIAMAATFADDHNGDGATRPEAGSIIDAYGDRWDYTITRRAVE